MKKQLASQINYGSIGSTLVKVSPARLEKEGTPYYSANSNLEFDVKNEEHLKENPILYYASKIGLLPAEYTKYQDLVLHIGDGANQKKYVYNQNNNTLSLHDSFGTRYYNKNDEETKREKFLLTYELKKLYLKNQEEEYTQKLQKGEFDDANLVVEGNSLQIKFLEEKIKYIDKVIDILSEQTPNYGSSFSEQIDSFIKSLQDLKHFSDKLNKAEWDEQVVNFINKSFLENTRLSKSLEDQNVIDLDDNKEKLQQFIGECIYLIRSKNFKIENIRQLKNSQKYIELNKVRSKEFFGGLIRDIKHQVLVIRKKQIEKELSKTKYIEGEIRRKQDEIRKIRGDFSQEYQISEKDEERYKRLFKAQQLRTNKEYRDGLSRTKERAEEDNLKTGIRYCKYEVGYEEKDLEEVTQIDKEYLSVKSKEEYIANKKQEIVNLREDNIPTLEEELDLLPIIVQKLNDKLAELSSKTKECKDLAQEEQRNITEIEKNNVSDEADIKAKYKILSRLLTEIEELKTEIEELNSEKAAVREEEKSLFKNNIFEKAGGQKKGHSDTGFVNHVDCKPDLPLYTSRGHCLYRSAIDSTVDFALYQVEQGIEELNKEALFNHLKSYTHSADEGKGKHANDLIIAGKRVFNEYRDVKNRIKQREGKYQEQITRSETRQQTKEKERDKLRTEIIKKENELNESNMKLSVAHRKKKILDCQRNNEVQQEFLNTCKETAIEQQEFISAEIIKKKEEISNFVDNIADKKEEINELETKINKESEYNTLLALSEARWRYSQYERIITNIGYLEKQITEQERLQSEKNTILKKLEANAANKKNLESKQENTKVEIKAGLATIEQLIVEKNDLIATRSILERQSSIGLVNTIQACREELKKIEEQQGSEIKAMNEYRVEIIKREVYKKLDLVYKGTTNNNEDFLEDIGTVNQLYKKRRHKNCQDVFNKDSQVCKYFDAIDIIIKILLQIDSTSDQEIFTELTSKHDNYENHVLVKHNTDINKTIKIIRNEVSVFNTKVEETNTKYTQKQEPINKLITDTKEQLVEKKKLDGVIIVKNLDS
ncbi:MAG: hypothetical protein LF885_07165 (plasmid) [Rickettsia endosymbiont of Culicoides impunctatus]|nr:MAG: hypothetical protein LF885_07165 [Rickettsia endosymbiont of Culicoides impunctatus]